MSARKGNDGGMKKTAAAVVVLLLMVLFGGGSLFNHTDTDVLPYEPQDASVGETAEQAAAGSPKDAAEEENGAEVLTAAETEHLPEMEVDSDVQWTDTGVTVTYEFRTDQYLNEHFEKHGDEFGYADAQEYLAGANRVIQDEDALHKLEAEDGDDVYYLEETNEFVIVSPQGYIRTYFKPSGGIDYYNRQ